MDNTESLYWKLKFVFRGVQIFSSLIERSFIHMISVNPSKSLMKETTVLQWTVTEVFIVTQLVSDGAGTQGKNAACKSSGFLNI